MKSTKTAWKIQMPELNTEDEAGWTLARLAALNADIEEIKQGTDPANPKSYPGSNDQPVIPSTGKNEQPTNPSTGKKDQTYIPALVGTNSPNQLASQTKNTFTSAKDDTQIKANNHHLSMTVAKTFTASSATLPETGTSDLSCYLHDRSVDIHPSLLWS